MFTKELDPHLAMFNEAIAFLQRLEDNPDDKILPYLIIFQFAILDQSGSKPLCDCCANCKRKFADNWREFYFSPSASGLVCRDCETAFVDKKKISGRCAKCLSRPEKVSDCDNKTLAEMQNLLIDYETHIVERPMRTAPMILKLVKRN